MSLRKAPPSFLKCLSRGVYKNFEKRLRTFALGLDCKNDYHRLMKVIQPLIFSLMILSGTLQAQTVQYSSEIKQQNCPQGYDVVNCTGTGTLEYPNGEKYIGQLNFGKPEGSGTLILKDGLRFVGTFIKGVGTQGSIFGANGSSLDSDEWPGSMFIRIPKHAIQKNVTTSIAELSNAQQIENQRLKTHLANVLAVQPYKAQSSALVIGNATYKVNPLKNPVNYSTDMARSLRSVGFDVIEANNTTLAQMREATRRFADKLGNSDVGLVYYSGHGVEVKGKNYLIPVNADIKREYEVVDQAFDASQFLEMMDNIRGPNNKRVNILIVDACHNNELQKSWRSNNNGLARMDEPRGMFISFATASGRVAADGKGRNSPYAKHLLQALKQPNVPIQQVFKVVGRNMMEETQGEQIPWESSSLVGDFYFRM